MVDWKIGCPYWRNWNTPILQVWRLGYLDAWMLAGLDWIGSEWLLDRRKWLDGVDGRMTRVGDGDVGE